MPRAPPGVTQSYQFFKRDSSSEGNDFSEEEEGEEEEKVAVRYGGNSDDSF
jgi:hypothetical protein